MSTSLKAPRRCSTRMAHRGRARRKGTGCGALDRATCSRSSDTRRARALALLAAVLIHALLAAITTATLYSCAASSVAGSARAFAQAPSVCGGGRVARAVTDRAGRRLRGTARGHRRTRRRSGSGAAADARRRLRRVSGAAVRLLWSRCTRSTPSAFVCARPRRRCAAGVRSTRPSDARLIRMRRLRWSYRRGRSIAPRCRARPDAGGVLVDASSLPTARRRSSPRPDGDAAAAAWSRALPRARPRCMAPPRAITCARPLDVVAFAADRAAAGAEDLTTARGVAGVWWPARRPGSHPLLQGHGVVLVAGIRRRRATRLARRALRRRASCTRGSACRVDGVVDERSASHDGCSLRFDRAAVTAADGAPAPAAPADAWRSMMLLTPSRVPSRSATTACPWRVQVNATRVVRAASRGDAARVARLSAGRASITCRPAAVGGPVKTRCGRWKSAPGRRNSRLRRVRRRDPPATARAGSARQAAPIARAAHELEQQPSGHRVTLALVVGQRVGVHRVQIRRRRRRPRFQRPASASPSATARRSRSAAPSGA